MKLIRELGADFRRTKGVTLMSCGCCCCCSCLHSVGAGYFFGKSATKVAEIAQGNAGEPGIGPLAAGALFVVPFAIILGIVGLSGDKFGGTGMILLGFAPAVLPILALASWLAAAIAVLVGSVVDSAETRAARMEALGRIGGEYLRATGWSLIWTIPLFILSLVLGPIGLSLLGIL